MKKKIKLSDLFYNNRFLLVFSVIVAVGFWLFASIEFAAVITETKTNIPVQIDYKKIEENFGLKPFGETDFTVDVTVSGQKYVVDADDIVDDIVVTTSTVVSSPGTQTLKLDVSTKSERPGYNIIELSDDEIEVYFDYPKTKEFLVEAEIDISESSVADGYHLGEFIFQEANKVSVSGPEIQVNKIEKVVASAVVDGSLTENTTVDAALSVITKDGSGVNYIKFNRQSESIQITLPVYKISTLPVECSFVNIPSEYINEFPFEVKIEPSTAVFGIPEKKLEGIDGIDIYTIDFSELRPGINTFYVPASDISGVVMLDGTEKFTVTVDTGNVVSSILEVPLNIEFNNLPSGMTAELVSLSFTHMTVCGPKESLDKLTKDSMVLVANLENTDDSAKGEIAVPVTLSSGDCWSYGSYIATIRLT
ncbi:MAG: hypothetical protein IJD78_05150 [Clostridia bacterium]|nr:hypothetical protein [Clostridia bacterium]